MCMTSVGTTGCVGAIWARRGGPRPYAKRPAGTFQGSAEQLGQLQPQGVQDQSKDRSPKQQVIENRVRDHVAPSLLGSLRSRSTRKRSSALVRGGGGSGDRSRRPPPPRSSGVLDEAGVGGPADVAVVAPADVLPR